ncbi:MULTISPECIES: FHA domain-containing protein [Mycobacterium]|uniref:FHA domain-containing protein n=1 Tax=Mycobacterium TaxID=1763 RepID=UPI001EF1598E|nr:MULTISPECIES: FHA domain-containing protein [Mycobacterium]BDB42139.1 hypothetical protein IWGMT90018_25850 [Mycobacterium kiyosense]BDE14575.1 hypothetical protein MKCMC460_34350 [Mycobacterium sp. 20KCMC460]GLB92584.1 hypothetical protein SRL2020130_54010 [Mycobacterium kiyosense]GLC10786.1 hypothetical protein SRL2020411_54320 [Mycobacterium kiyosense]GLC16731.1 hypothetical protein SRL2020448_53340 [Mycobacterium kiyosense]
MSEGKLLPPLTVWLASAMYTFYCGEVTVGRHRDCDIWLHDGQPAVRQLVSRIHAILRFDGTQWRVVDTSRYGVFLGGVRVGPLAIRDRQTVTLGSPQGPRLTFGVGNRFAASIPPSLPTLKRIAPTITYGRAQAASTAPFTRPQPCWEQLEVDRLAHTMGPPPPQSLVAPETVGRDVTNELVVDDAFASRVHAVLESTTAGLEIRDVNSANATSVNGVPATRALLREGGNVTVGKTNLVVTGATLRPQRRPPAGTALPRWR